MKTRSATMMSARWVGKKLNGDWGSYLFDRAWLVVVVTFTAAFAWMGGHQSAVTEWKLRLESVLMAAQIKLVDEIKTNRALTIENGCIGMAILVQLSPDRYALPQGCAEVIARIPERTLPAYRK